jgi:hypothetical protein
LLQANHRLSEKMERLAAHKSSNAVQYSHIGCVLDLDV